MTRSCRSCFGEKPYGPVFQFSATRCPIWGSAASNRPCRRSWRSHPPAWSVSARRYRRGVQTSRCEGYGGVLGQHHAVRQKRPADGHIGAAASEISRGPIATEASFRSGGSGRPINGWWEDTTVPFVGLYPLALPILTERRTNLNRSGETGLVSLDDGNKADVLIGAMTWSRTQIGPIGSWSRSLQTTIDVPLHNCLPSREPRANGLGPPHFSEDRTSSKQPRAVIVVRADAFVAEAETPLHENEAPDVGFNDQRQPAC
jgi:hypothetical protein